MSGHCFWMIRDEFDHLVKHGEKCMFSDVYLFKCYPF